jgi:hypothetical protein
MISYRCPLREDLGRTIVERACPLTLMSLKSSLRMGLVLARKKRSRRRH